MNTRTDALLAIRPAITATPQPDTGADEAFQTLTLRPILKFQHPLLCRRMVDYLVEIKQSLAGKTPEQQAALVAQCLTNKALHSAMLGMVTGLFTEEEYTFYAAHRKEANKRITSMLIQRLVDGLGKG